MEKVIEQKLTNEQISQLCMFMRVIDVLQKNRNIWNENPQMKEAYDKHCYHVNSIMEMLSEEQRNKVLKEHKLQAQKIAKQETKNIKRQRF